MRIRALGKQALKRALAVAALALFAPAQTSAQSISPMRGEIKSFTDQFAVRVNAMNPYDKRMLVEIKVYDDKFNPVPATVLPAQSLVGAQDSRTVMVMVPFSGDRERRVRICAESVPFSTESHRVRTQVCGKFIARRMP